MRYFFLIYLFGSIYVSYGQTESIDKKIQDQIFDPIFTTKDVGHGEGLGLSISYGIIEKHDGKIEVKSEIRKGSEFIITLPLDLNES